VQGARKSPREIAWGRGNWLVEGGGPVARVRVRSASHLIQKVDDIEIRKGKDGKGGVNSGKNHKDVEQPKASHRQSPQKIEQTCSRRKQKKKRRSYEDKTEKLIVSRPSEK